MDTLVKSQNRRVFRPSLEKKCRLFTDSERLYLAGDLSLSQMNRKIITAAILWEAEIKDIEYFRKSFLIY